MSNQTPAVPDFVDTSAAATDAADDLLRGFDNSPLTLPPGTITKSSKGNKYSRFTESVTITHAYRTVTRTGLLDVVLGTLVRQSEANNGRRVFFHFYKNVGEDVSEGHMKMNAGTDAVLDTLVQATGFAPRDAQGNRIKGLKGTLLRQLFPEKGAPGTGNASQLVGKLVVVNITQVEKQQRDKDTKQLVVDEEGLPVMETRDGADSFLPDEVVAEA
jgi:hypothetical protein